MVATKEAETPIPEGEEEWKEIEELWVAYLRTRAPERRDQLIVHYLPYVRRMVRKLSLSAPGYFDADDATSYGVIGLIEAIERFEPGRGIRFEAYAATRVRGAVIDQLRSPSWRRTAPPAGAQPEPTAEAPSADHPTAKAIRRATAMLSLDEPIDPRGGEEMHSLVDVLGDQRSIDPAEEAEREDAIRALTAALRELPERERLVLTLYYYEELTLRDIGELLGLSRARICQICQRAIFHLRGRMAVLPKSYWPEAWGTL